MNILEIEDIIKGLPDQSLIQEAQAPSGQMPQFLVVSEIQRRADMRKRFQNQQQEMPQGTIAQQIVQGGIASMGNQQPIQPMPPQGMPQQGMPPQGMPPMPPQGMPSAMQQQPPMMPPMSPPMSPPMMPPAQGMAGGGVVRMQAGKVPPYTGGTGLTEYGQNLFSQGLGEGQTVEEIVRNIYNYRPSTIATARGSRRDPDQPSTEEYIKSVYGDDFSTPGLYSIFRGPGAESLYMEEVMGRIGSSVPVTESPIPSSLTTDVQGSATETLPTGEIPSIDSLMQYKSPLSFGDNYNVENPLDMDSKRFYETTLAQDPSDLASTISLGLNDRTTKDKVAEDVMKRPQGPDYSAAKSILDELQAVDYSAFKPDYAGLITEQERRAQKIRDDASKDASAQALIQLGAGLAAGDISKGLSAAGQSVADIKRQARAEARDEEGFARQLRLAQDEAGMQIGLKQAEAQRSIQLERAGLSKGEADALANAEVRAYEFKQEFGLKESELAAGIRRDIMTSGKSSLSALIEQWKDLADAATEEDIAERNNLANQIKVLVEEQKTLRDELRGSLNADSSLNTVATAPKQNEKKDTDVIEAARSLLGNR
jgi:hypothetical protein